MKLSTSEFAEVVGVDYTTAYRWETGESAPRGKRIKRLLEDLMDKAFGPPWDRERARAEVAKRLGVDLDHAGQLLIEYGRSPGEPWRDVCGRVVDGERHHKLGRVAEA